MSPEELEKVFQIMFWVQGVFYSTIGFIGNSNLQTLPVVI